MSKSVVGEAEKQALARVIENTYLGIEKECIEFVQEANSCVERIQCQSIIEYSK